MADIPGWLRGFQRARTQNVITSDSLSPPNETNEVAEKICSAPSTARMSSYWDFGRLPASSLLAKGQPHLNQVERIWHNPDPDQMAETLKVAMMTQNSFDPLHVPYNSCILHVLEAYHHMRKELIEKDREIRDQEQRHENDIKDFRQQQVRWKVKEDGYKSELKKLEVILATKARGLELVTLTRSRSALNGTTKPEAAESQQREKESERQDVTSDEEPMMSNFSERKDSLVSASYTSRRRRLNTRRKNGALTPRQLQRSEQPTVIGQPSSSTKYANKNTNANSDANHPEQLYDIAHCNTRSECLSRLEQNAQRCTEQYARSLGDLVSNRTHVVRDQKIKDSNKPLPEVPVGPKQAAAKDKNEEEEEDETILYYGEVFRGRSVIHHGRFSFIPGDDYGTLDPGRARTQATVAALDGYGNSRRPSSSYLSPSNNFIEPVPPRKQRRIRPVLAEEGGANAVRGRSQTTGCEFASSVATRKPASLQQCQINMPDAANAPSIPRLLPAVPSPADSPVATRR